MFTSDKGAHMSDPVRHCTVYRTVGCAHVAGYLCHMKTCDILKSYLEEPGKFQNLNPAPKKIYESNRATKSTSEYKKNG